MLEHTRAVTLQEINDLSVEQLDSIMSSGGNSIGALLKHIAAIEKLTNLFHFKNVTLQRRIRNMGRRTLFRESGERFVDMKYSIMYNFCKSSRRI